MSFVIPGVIGIAAGDMVYLRPKRLLQSNSLNKTASSAIQASVTVEEIHHDRVMVTDQPVEIGSPISDHSFNLPAEVTINMIWSDSAQPAVNGIFGFGMGALGNTIGAAIAIAQTGMAIAGTAKAREAYAKLIEAKEKRIIFDVFTGKRDYRNMLIVDVAMETNATRESIADVRVTLREIFFARAVTNLTSSQNPNQDVAAQRNAGTPASSGNVMDDMREKISGIANKGMQQLQPVVTDVREKINEVFSDALELVEQWYDEL